MFPFYELLLLLLLLTAVGLSHCGSGYFTCIQNMKLVTTKFKSGGLHEKLVVATWNFGNQSQRLLIDTGKPRKTCVEVAGRRTFRILTSSSKLSHFTSWRPRRGLEV